MATFISNTDMFVAVYKWKIEPGKEFEFQSCWENGTRMFRDEHGALGSRLHRGDDSIWMAYAQWPSREMYFKKRELSDEHAELQSRMHRCIKESEPTTFYEVKSDYILTEP